MSLTPRQKQLLDAIKVYIADHDGIAPTLQEMADVLDVSRVTILEHLKALTRKGSIRRGKGARSIEVAAHERVLVCRTSAVGATTHEEIPLPAGWSVRHIRTSVRSASVECDCGEGKAVVQILFSTGEVLHAERVGAGAAREVTA